MTAPSKPGELHHVSCRWDPREGRWRCVYTTTDGRTYGDAPSPPKPAKGRKRASR